MKFNQNRFILIVQALNENMLSSEQANKLMNKFIIEKEQEDLK